MIKGNQKDRAERLCDWFDLQLRLVDAYICKSNRPFEEVVTFYTNLHRRFGFGRPGGESKAPEWIEYLERLASMNTHSARVEWTTTFAVTHLQEFASHDLERCFGCFGFDPPNDEGIVKIHFAPNDKQGGIGPLGRIKADRRRDELAQMFAHIRNEHPHEAQEVLGASWLYNLEAYRRLFPPDYGDSRATYTNPSMTLAGGSSWGQFLDHDKNVRRELRDTFLANLPKLDPNALWKLFPMPCMITRAPISVFYDFYSI